MKITEASTWQQRQEYLTRAYEYMAKMHNELGITESLTTRVSQFYNRPFMIIRGSSFADAIHAEIKDDEVKQLPRHLGGIDQYVDSTEVLAYSIKFRKFWSMYQ